MLRIALTATLLTACAAATVVGATTVTTAALGTSALQRKSGGCYAVCTGGTLCNPLNGLCERMPCDGRCGADEHCESTMTETRCAPGAPGDIASKAPGTGRSIPLLPPPTPDSNGPPQMVPAAEKNPPSGH